MLDASAKIIKSGTFNDDGKAELSFVLPPQATGKTYFQVLTGRKNKDDKKNPSRDEDVSTVMSVASLEELLKLVTISGGVGPQGLQGATGPQGPRGEAGAPGEAGPQGSTGVKGDTGATGAQGLQGATGAQGLQGATGAVGERGLQGEIGAPGPAGPQGSKGETGAQGPRGLDGNNGEQGVAGEKGDAGPAGAKGDTGLKGETGAQGLKGDQGDTGPRGEPGLPGAQGIQGIKGDTGTVGPAGPHGVQGIKGDTGEQGPQGIQGPAGAQGQTGAAGITPVAHCPTGWLDLGPTCIEPNFDSSATIEQAIQECYQMGARVCEHQDLAFACQNHAAMSLSFPDSTWLHTGTVMLRSLGGSSTNNFVGYAVFRKVGGRCFGPSTVNPADAVVGYDLATTARNYACCADRSF